MISSDCKSTSWNHLINAYRITKWLCAFILLNLLISSVIFSQNYNSEKHPIISTLLPSNPPLKTMDINSISIRLPSTGPTHVVSFLNKHSGNAVKVWANFLPMKKLKNSRIQFTNIVFLGDYFL